MPASSVGAGGSRMDWVDGVDGVDGMGFARVASRCTHTQPIHYCCCSLLSLSHVTYLLSASPASPAYPASRPFTRSRYVPW